MTYKQLLLTLKSVDADKSPKDCVSPEWWRNHIPMSMAVGWGGGSWHATCYSPWVTVLPVATGELLSYEHGTDSQIDRWTDRNIAYYQTPTIVRFQRVCVSCVKQDRRWSWKDTTCIVCTLTPWKRSMPTASKTECRQYIQQCVHIVTNNNNNLRLIICDSQVPMMTSYREQWLAQLIRTKLTIYM